MTHTISSNQFSHDTQVQDALDYLRISHPGEYCEVVREFPDNLIFEGASVDTEAMGVDCEYVSWLTDRIESTGRVYWVEGEPFASEAEGWATV
jgi:hypothetical protein